MAFRNRHGLGFLLLALVALQGCKSRKEAAEAGSFLHSALRQKVTTLDPAFSSDYYASVLVSRAYEGLYQYQYLARPYVLEPALAAALPEVLEGGRLLRIQLKKGVYFQADACLRIPPHSKNQSREVTAEDVVYSWKRVMDTKLASPGAWLLEGKVADLKAVNATTIEVRLVAPEPQLLHAMALPFLSVVPQECVEHYGADFAWHPVGTGPFRLKSSSPTHYEWERNPLYREVNFPHEEGNPDSGKRLPFLNGIVDDVIEEDQTAWLAFMNGEHDMMGRVSPERVASGEVQAQETKGMRFLKETAADFTYFAFNMDDPVVGGYSPSVKHLRKALSLAYDVAPVIDKFYSGMAKPAHFVIPPGFPEYDPTYKNPNATYNLVQAREHLAKAGYPRGEGLPELVLDAPADANSRLHAEYFARCMERIGVKVRLSLSPWAEMLARVRRRQGQIYAVTWVYDYPDAESGLSTLVAANASPGPNKSNYKNPSWDRLYEQVRSLVPGPKRTALVKQMRKIFEEDAPWIFGVHRAETRLLHPWVVNYKIHLFDFGVEKYIRMRAHGPGTPSR